MFSLGLLGVLCGVVLLDTIARSHAATHMFSAPSHARCRMLFSHHLSFVWQFLYNTHTHTHSQQFRPGQPFSAPVPALTALVRPSPTLGSQGLPQSRTGQPRPTPVTHRAAPFHPTTSWPLGWAWAAQCGTGVGLGCPVQTWGGPGLSSVGLGRDWLTRFKPCNLVTWGLGCFI